MKARVFGRTAVTMAGDALRRAVVGSAPWLVLASVWAAGRISEHAAVDEDGRPRLRYLTQDGRFLADPPGGRAEVAGER